MFKRAYRMSILSFNRLLEMLVHYLREMRNSNVVVQKRMWPITREQILHCTLCYLRGGSIHDVQLTVGISSISIHRIVHHGIDVINTFHGLSIMFPSTLQDLIVSADEFKNLSSHGLYEWMCCSHGLIA
jgi:hypothetical protein